MKRIYVLGLACCLMLSSCESSVKEESYQSSVRDIQMILQHAPSELSEIQNAPPYQNLDFAQAVLNLPSEAEAVYELNLSRPSVEQDEEMDLFFKMLSETFSSETAADHANLFFSSPSIPVDFNEFTAEYPAIYNGTNYDRIRKNELAVDFFLYQTDTNGPNEKDAYFLLGTEGGLIKMNRGTCTRSVEKERALAGWMPIDNYAVSAVYATDSEDSFLLSDSNVCICDAAAFCENYFSSDLFSADTDALQWRAESVGVMKTNDTHHAFYIPLARTYGGIPFDGLHTEGVLSEFSDGNDYLFENSEALMIGAKEIEFYYLAHAGETVTASDAPIDIHISLGNAAKVLSETITQALMFDVETISLVYSNRRLDAEHSTARVHWRFQLINPNDELVYAVYIDIETGESYYYAY